MRNKFDQELSNMHDDLISMAAMVETAISRAVEALKYRDASLAKLLQEKDHEIDQKERAIESSCLKLLLQQQPVASDLRVISSALKSVYDLERIGDVTGDIANLILKENVSIASDILNLSAMAEETGIMVQQAVTALTKQNRELAEETIAMDDSVDAYFKEAKKTLAKRFTVNDTGMEYALNLLMVAKYFEKIGDHAVNIANWAVFSATGILSGTQD